MSVALYAESVLRSAGIYGIVDGSLRNFGKEDVYQALIPYNLFPVSQVDCPFEPSFFIIYPLSIDTSSTSNTVGKFITAISNPDTPYGLIYVTGYRSGSSGAKVTTLNRTWSYSDGAVHFGNSLSGVSSVAKFGFLAIP